MKRYSRLDKLFTPDVDAGELEGVKTAINCKHLILMSKFSKSMNSFDSGRIDLREQ